MITEFGSCAGRVDHTPWGCDARTRVRIRHQAWCEYHAIGFVRDTMEREAAKGVDDFVNWLVRR